MVLLGLLAGLRLVIGVRSILDPTAVAQGADGIPLDRMPAGAARELISMFAQLGVQQIEVAAIAIFALWRRRELVPAVFALLIGQRLLGMLAIWLHPAGPTEPNVPGDLVGLVLLALTVAGGLLSVWPGPRQPR